MKRLAISLAALAALVTSAAPLAGRAQEGRYDEDVWDSGSPPPPDAVVDDGRVDVSVDGAGGSVTFDTFHDGLAPYGEWVTVANYGRVWRPHVAAGWRPYYYGRWEWTDEGWLWVSDEPWGWAAYHYGRWSYDPYFGWLWVPGYQWAPAWVSWRYSPDYIGWAPLAPGLSVYVTAYPVHYGWWNFVPCGRFVGYPVYRVAYTGEYVRNIWHGTRPAPPRAAVYGAPAPAWGGPARPFVERSVGRPITPVRIQPVASPGAMAAPARPGVVSIYRPEVRPAPGGAMARPSAPAPGLAPARPMGAPAGQAPGAAPRPFGAPGGNAPARPFGVPGQAVQAPSQGGAARPFGAPSGSVRSAPVSPRPFGAPAGAVQAPARPFAAPGAAAPRVESAPRAAPQSIAPRGAPQGFAPRAMPQGSAPRAMPQGGGFGAPRMAAPHAGGWVARAPARVR